MPQIRRLTDGPLHHFYGYYDVCPWNRAGTAHAALETAFHERAPEADDTATVGLVDAETGAFRPVAETRAFNLQQGAMLNWIDAGHGEELTYNDWDGDRLVARAINPDTDERRTLQRPVAAVSPAGPVAVGLDQARMHFCRRVVGYANSIHSEDDLDPIPEDDGLFRIDLTTGEAELMVSIADAERLNAFDGPDNCLRWFNHPVYSTDGSRIAFLARVKQPAGWVTSLWTVGADGSDLRCLIGYGGKISHFTWCSPTQLLLSCDVLGPMQFVTLDDPTAHAEPFGGGRFPDDGHMTYSPDRRWIACDTYPRGPERLAKLFVYDTQTGERVDLGAFHHPEHIHGDWRCDLHPRWSRDGRCIAFDSVHEGSRQIYAVDVSDLTG